MRVPFDNKLLDLIIFKYDIHAPLLFFRHLLIEARGAIYYENQVS